MAEWMPNSATPVESSTDFDTRFALLNQRKLLMRIATWNVNSIRARVDRVVDYLHRGDIDVLAMQEIKCRDSQFPYAAFEEAGYELSLIHI